MFTILTQVTLNDCLLSIDKEMIYTIYLMISTVKYDFHYC